MAIENSRKRLIEALDRRFCAEFGGSDHRFFFAPGRVNLLGAHLDYNGGDVLPMGVDRGLYCAARPRTDGRLRLISLDQDLAVELDAAEVGTRGRPEWGWANYPLGVFCDFRQQTGVDRGFECVFAGDLPMASGLSSSAAIEVATGTALNALFATGLSRQQIAVIAHAAENGFVGLRCGIMDQFASALATPGNVLLLHCAGPSYEHVPFDAAACEVLVMDTKKPRELALSGFNERVAECAKAHEILRTHVRDLPHLAHYDRSDLERGEQALSRVLYARVRHVVSEMERMRLGVEALRADDYARLGELLDASNASASGDYAVSCDELDVITAAASEQDEVFGARLTGAGFGGCAIALIRPGTSDEVAAAVEERFEARFGIKPEFDLLRIGTGPGEIGPPG